MVTFALKMYVLILLPIEMPVIIKEYISLQCTITVWAGVAGLDRMRCEEYHYKKINLKNPEKKLKNPEKACHL